MSGDAFYPLWVATYLVPLVLLSGAAAYPILRRFGETTRGICLGQLAGGIVAFVYGNFWYLVLARLWESVPDHPPAGDRPAGYADWFVVCVFGGFSVGFALAGWVVIGVFILVWECGRRWCGYAPRADSGTDS